MTTTIHVIGTIATDPRLVTPASGRPLCSFRLASDERHYDREQQSWVDGATNWFGVVCFRSLAEHGLQSFRKGDRVIVSGRLRIRNWEADGRRGTSVEIEADAIGHDIRWGVSRFEKRTSAKSENRTNDEGGEDQPAPGAPHLNEVPPQIRGAEEAPEAELGEEESNLEAEEARAA